MGQPDGEGRSLEARQARAREDIEQVVRRFHDDPAAWQDLREQIQAAETDDDRVKVLVDFATSEGALGRFTTQDPLRPVAATPTVTTVTVTTVTTV